MKRSRDCAPSKTIGEDSSRASPEIAGRTAAVLDDSRARIVVTTGCGRGENRINR